MQYSNAKTTGAIAYGLYREEMEGFGGAGINFGAGLRSLGSRFARVSWEVDPTKLATAGSFDGIAYTRRQLQHGFKHADDFGINANPNNKTLSEFSTAVQRHVDNVAVRQIDGTYRGRPVTHFVNPATGVNVIRDSSGNFLSGWKLNPQQLENVLTRGKL
jgi:hypothetical protein